MQTLIAIAEHDGWSFVWHKPRRQGLVSHEEAITNNIKGVKQPSLRLKSETTVQLNQCKTTTQK